MPLQKISYCLLPGPYAPGYQAMLLPARKRAMFDRYRELIGKLTGWDTGRLVGDCCDYLELEVSSAKVIRVYHPDEIAGLCNQRYWAIDYGDPGYDDDMKDIRLPAGTSVDVVVAKVREIAEL